MKYPQMMIGCWLLVATLSAVAGTPAKQASQPKALAMVTINGTPLRINVGSDSAFQVYNAALPDAQGQIYPNDGMLGNAGFFVHEGNRTVGFDSFENQQIGTVSGSGTVNNPFAVSSTGSPGFENLNYQEVVSYSNGQNFFTKRLTLTNHASSARSLKVFLYGDLYLANNDNGVPFLQTQAGAPGGETCPGLPTYTILFIPRSPAASGYQAGFYNTVATAVINGSLDNTVETGCLDNGAAVQWDLTLPPNGASLSVEAIISFGDIPSGVITPTLSLSVNPSTTAPASTSTLSWSSSVPGATCTPGGGTGTNWASLGALPAAGSRSVTVPSTLGTIAFTLSCTTASTAPVVATTTLSIVAAPPPVVLSSQTSGVSGQPPNSFSGRPVLSDRAGFIAFESAASNLVPGDTNGAQDIFVRERSSNVLKLVSVDADGAPLTGLVSGEPAIARDGARLAFVAGTAISQTDGLSAKRRVSNGQVRVYDARTAKGTQISNAPNGAPGNASSNNPQLVQNIVVYQSAATNLTAELDVNGVSDIFAHDLSTGITSLLSAPNVTTQGTPKAAGCGSARPRITSNNIVVFESCQVLGTGLNSTAISHIHATTVASKRSVLITRNASGVPGSADSNNAAISSDGRFVYFDSAADNLVSGDSNGRRDVFRAPLTLNGSNVSVGPVERVSLSFQGQQGDGNSERPATCGEGRYVTFESDASNLFPQSGGSGVRNILAKDMLTGLVAKLSQTSSSGNASGASSEPALSPDCSAVVFATEASNLSSSAAAGSPDVVLASNPLNLSYTGHWHNPRESGWGLTIAHQGDVLFPNWFTFDIDGKPLWLSMVAGARLQPDGSYTGAIYRSNGIPFNLPGGGTASLPLPIVGQGKLSFTAANSLRFDYTIGSVSQSKLLEPLFFGGPTICEFAPGINLTTASNFTDVWDNNATEPGWGVQITHQGDTIFGLWYTYDSNGRDQWLTGTVRRSGSNVFTGELRRLSGIPFSSINGVQSFLTAPVVGSVSFAFASGTQGTMNYTLDGITMSKPLRRYVFGSPATLCRPG